MFAISYSHRVLQGLLSVFLCPNVCMVAVRCKTDHDEETPRRREGKSCIKPVALKRAVH